MPRLGWTMDTGTLAEWLKHDGDTVQVGDILFTVETDKVAQEVEAIDSGILRIPPDAAAIGTALPVGSVLAYLVQPGEDAPFQQSSAALASVPDAGVAAAGAPVTPVTAGASISLAPGVDGPTISPRARRIASELGVDWTAINGSGRTGRIVERDVRAVATQASATRTRITPIARRVAQQSGVDVDEVAAQMPGKRITRADIEAVARPAAVAELNTGHAQPLSRVRRIIADRMSQSAHTVASVTLTTEVDATELVAVRERIKRAVAGSERRTPSYNDLLARLVALALLEHPQMNSSLTDDAIVRHDAVHLGIAVDTEHGLLVPVIRDAHLKSIQRIAEESADLIARTRVAKATSDELRGSTFSITNLGMFEIDAFTPIINLPECAILGVGRIISRPVVIDEDTEEIAVRKMLVLSLTFDHRVVDGAPAARFLQHLKRWIEQPYSWLTS